MWGPADGSPAMVVAGIRGLPHRPGSAARVPLRAVRAAIQGQCGQQVGLRREQQAAALFQRVQQHGRPASGPGVRRGAGLSAGAGSDAARFAARRFGGA